MIALTPHLDNAVVGHGLEGPREIARFATSRLGQRCNGLRVRVLDYVQQGTVLIAQHLGEPTHRIAPDLGLARLWFVLAASNAQDALPNLV